MNSNQREESLTLEVLEAIEQRDNITQRHLADRMGVALGLANSYLKRCVRKGLVKIHQAPANRYLYYLTPKGFSEKSRLTAKYLSISFDFYRKAGDSYRSVLAEVKQRDGKSIIFCGVSELTEIASLRILEFGLDHVFTYEPNSTIDKYLGRPVIHEINKNDDVDAYLITTLDAPDLMYANVVSEVGKQKVFVPKLLGLPN